MALNNPYPTANAYPYPDEDPYLRRLKQTPVGTSRMVVNSPQAIEELGSVAKIVPNAAWMGLGVLSLGAGLAYDAVADEPLPSDHWLKKSTQYAESGIGNAEALWNTGPAQDSWDTWARNAGDVLVPGALPTKAATALTPLALRQAPQVAESLGTSIAKGVGSIAFPASQTQTLAGKALEAGITATIEDTFLEIRDPEYQSAIIDAEKVMDGSPEAVYSDTQQQFLDKMSLIEAADARVTTDIPYGGDINSIQNPEITHGGTIDDLVLEQHRQSDGSVQGATQDDTDRSTGFARELLDFTVDNATVLTGIAALGALSGRTYYAARKARLRASEADAASDLSGVTRIGKGTKKAKKIENESTESLSGLGWLPGKFSSNRDGVLGVKQVANAQMLDNLGPLQWLIKKGEEAGKLSTAKARSLNDSVRTRLETRSISNMIRDTARSGTFPVGPNPAVTKPITHRPLANIYEEAAELDGNMTGKLRDILIGESRYDDLQVLARKFKGGHRKTPKWGNESARSLRKRAQELRKSNPQLARLADDAQGIMKSVPQYLLRTGRITQKQANTWKYNSPHFMPLRLSKNGEFTPNSFMPRRNVKDPLAIQPGESDDPLQLMFGYMGKMIKEAELNQVRRVFVKTMMNDFNMTTAKGKPLFEQITGVVPKGKKATQDLISYYDNGVLTHVKVNDPHLRMILNENPRLAAGWSNVVAGAIRKPAEWKKWWTTGLGSVFSPTAALYDSGAVFMTKHQDVNIGVLSKYLNNALTRRYDPSILASPVTGTIRNLYTDVSRNVARKLYADITNDGLIVGTFGKKLTAIIAVQAKNNFLNAGKRTFEQHGGGTSPTWIASGGNPTDIPDILAEIAPKYTRKISQTTNVRANKLYRAWTSLNDAFHGSARTEAFASNIKREGWSNAYKHETMKFPDGTTMDVPYLGRNIITSEDDLRHAASTIRETGADLTRRGGIPGTSWAKGYNLLLDSIIYSNVAIQSGAQFTKAAKYNPVGMIGGIATYFGLATAYIVNEILDDPVKKKRYSAMSPSQRARKIPVMDDVGNIALNVDMLNEVRPIWSAWIETIMLLDQDTEEGKSTPFSEGLRVLYDDFVPNMLPQAYKVGSAAVSPFFNQSQSDLGQYIDAPDWYSTELQKGTLKDTFTQSIGGALDNLSGTLITDIFNGAMIFAEATGEPTSTMEKIDNALSYVGATFRGEGEPTTMLFPTAIPQRVATDRPENRYAYETTTKIKSWLTDFKKVAVYRDRYSKNPKAGSEGRDKAQFADFADPELAMTIAGDLTAFDKQLQGKNYTGQLQIYRTQKQEAKYGGAAFPNKDAQMREDNEARRKQNITIDNMMKDIIEFEEFMNNKLHKKGLIPDDEMWTFDDLPTAPELSGSSTIKPVESFMPK